jgi:hypothetical protein
MRYRNEIIGAVKMDRKIVIAFQCKGPVLAELNAIFILAVLRALLVVDDAACCLIQTGSRAFTIST